MAELQLDHLTKVYPNSVRAVSDLSFSIRDGELLVLMGPSGCGKTTTLRLIAGLEEPTSGLIRLGGEVVNSRPIYRRDLAMVFQRPALYPHLTVRKNLTFGVRMRGETSALTNERLAEVARLLGLEDVLDRLPRQLSGGQQQRVALGRAVLRKPRAFLLDEPLSNLDARLRTEMRRELHLLHRRLRTTMVYVTHDQAEAMTLGDTIALLDAGILQQVGAPMLLYHRPVNRMVAASLGSPGMNFLDGELAGTGSEWAFQGKDSRLSLPRRVAERWAAFGGRPLTLGVRPENVIVADTGQEPHNNRESALAALNMKVGFIERLGDHALIGLQRKSWSLTAKVPMRARSVLPETEDAPIEVRLEMANVHLFDGDTGMALCHPESG